MENQENIEGFDLDQNWREAEKMLDNHFRQKRARKRIALLCIFGFLIFISTWMYFEFSGKNQIGKPAVTENPVVAPKPVITPQAEKSPVTPIANNKTLNSASHSSSPQVSPKKEKTILPHPEVQTTRADAKITTPKQPGNTGSLTVTSLPKVKGVKRKPDSPVAAVETAAVAEKTPIAKTEQIESASETPLASSAVKDKQETPATEAVNASSTTSENPTVESSSSENALPKIENPGEQIITERASVSLEVIPMLRLQPGKELTFVSRENEIVSVSAVPFPLPGYKGPRTVHWSYDIYGGVHDVSKNLSSKTENEYLLRRQQEELSILSPSLGTAVKAAIKNFSFSIGFEYSSWGEKTNYAPFIHQQQLVQNGYWQSFLTSYIDTDTAYVTGIQLLEEHSIQRTDSAYQTNTDTVDAKVYSAEIDRLNGTNRFQYVEVPMEVSYRFRFGKAGIGASVGIAPAWLTSQKGYYLKQDLSGMESIAETKPINTFSWNGRCSIDFYYSISDRFTLMLRPQVKTNMRSIAASRYNLDQKYYSTGVNFGVSYLIR